MKDVYITGLGKFLPGDPIGNDRIEDFLGRIGGRASRAKARVLRQNGIKTRHYALDTNQRTLFRSSEMAARAVNDALVRAGVDLSRLGFLSAATTQGDLLVPGFASMVHGELGGRPLEVASLHGVCASAMAGLKLAWLQIGGGQHAAAVACASEMPSRLFKASRFEKARARSESLPFETEFLRWMLSDGAGAAVLQDHAKHEGVSLRIEWIELTSHAHEQPLCMYAGANLSPEGAVGPSWLDYPSFEAAAREGTIDLKQDIRLLDRMVALGVAGFFELMERGLIVPDELDYVVCHHSSDFFRSKIFDLLAKGGVRIPPQRWFSNLETRGNTGAASLFLLLEELVNERTLEHGQRILCMIPESGRFIRSYAMLTVVRDLPSTHKSSSIPETSTSTTPPSLEIDADPLQERLVRGLFGVWSAFETKLARVPIVNRIESDNLDVDGYKELLINLRQQVVEGARWIARAASNITEDRFDLRASFIQHAREEQADFRMLERDYVSVGGRLEDIQRAPKNVGSEALSAWMFHQASAPNPFDLIGAMFIIEGLGAQKAHRWGSAIRDQLGLADAQVSFLLYHGANDDTHFAKLEAVVRSGVLTDALVERIVKTAKVTARLYVLQLEELGNV